MGREGGGGGGGQVFVPRHKNICKISRPLQLELYLRSLLTYHFHSVDGYSLTGSYQKLKKAWKGPYLRPLS